MRNVGLEARDGGAPARELGMKQGSEPLDADEDCVRADTACAGTKARCRGCGIYAHRTAHRSRSPDLVKRLKRKGLLQRKRTKEDARAYAVKLTEEGRKVVRTAEPLARRVDERILDALPAKRRTEFMSALASIIGALEAPAAA